MANSAPVDDRGGQARRPWLEAGFLGAVFLYVWLVTDPSLQFESSAWFPAFSLGPDFLIPFLHRPGGLTQYVSAYLSQYHYYAWAGAAITTGLAAVLMWAARTYITGCSGSVRGARPFAQYVAPVLVVIVCNQFGFHLASMVSLAIATTWAAGYAHLPVRSSTWRAVALLGGSALVYHIAGPPLIVAALMISMCEVSRAERLLGLVGLLCAEVIPYVGGVVAAGFGMDGAFARLTPLDWMACPQGRSALLALYAYYLLLAAGVALQHTRAAARLTKLRADLFCQLRPALRWALALALLVAPVAWSYNGRLHTVLRVERFAREKAWDRVLAEARQLTVEESTVSTSVCVNRALLALGRLSEEMFSYPQSPASLMHGMAAGGLSADQAYAARLHLYYEIDDAELQLGLVNDAEHEAHEALEVYGDQTVTLRRLALVNMVKGQVPAAEQFLRALTRHVIYGAWARERLAQLAADPSQASDPEVQRIRSVMLRDAPALIDWTPTARCRALLASNPLNRAAFELLMADHLLNRRLDLFVAELPRLDGLGYTTLPRHFQEAVLLYETETGRSVELGHHWIDPRIDAEFAAFCRLMAPYQARGALAQARQLAVERFGNSYFYYHLYQQSGGGRR